MKQVIQYYRTGDIELAEAPIPCCSSNTVLLKNVASLISVGTECSAFLRSIFLPLVFPGP